MFEFSLAILVNREIINLSKRSNWSRVRCVLIKIGMINALNPKLIAAAFAQISKGTVTEDTKLFIMTTPFIMRCQHCKNIICSEEKPFVCPYCGSHDLELASGLEYCVELLEVER